MTDLDKYLSMLKSPKADTRYDACEELRVATESSPEVILALEEAAQDEDESVAERARSALAADVHRQMGIKMGRPWAIPEIKSEEIKSESQTEVEPEHPIFKAESLAIASLVLSCVGLSLDYLIWNILNPPSPQYYGDFQSGGMCFLMGILIGGPLLGIISVLCGISAYWQIAKNAKIQNGKALAITGILLGILACLWAAYTILASL
jgi:hypothetical protein